MNRVEKNADRIERLKEQSRQNRQARQAGWASYIFLAAIGPLVLGRVKFMVVCQFLIIILEPWVPRVPELVGSL